MSGPNPMNIVDSFTCVSVASSDQTRDIDKTEM